MDWRTTFGAMDDDLASLLARRQAQDSVVFKVGSELQRRKEAEREFGLQEDNARENRALRESQQKSLDEDRKLRAEDRKADNDQAASVNFRSKLALRKKGDFVTPVEQVQFVREGLTGSTKAAGADEHSADPHFHFEGTQATDLAEQRQADMERQRQIQNDLAGQRVDISRAAADAAAARAAAAAAGKTTLTPAQKLTQERLFRGEVGKTMATARAMRQQLNYMETGLDAARKGDMNAGSQAVLVTFQKILDPNSVVRESEYARSPEGLGLMQRMEGLMPRLVKGGPGVPPEELEKFADLARRFVTNIETVSAKRAEPILRAADDYGLDRAHIMGDEQAQQNGSDSGSSSATSTGQGAPAALIWDPATKSFKKGGK